MGLITTRRYGASDCVALTGLVSFGVSVSHGSHRGLTWIAHLWRADKVSTFIIWTIGKLIEMETQAEEKSGLGPAKRWLVYVLIAAGLTWFVWTLIPAIDVYRNTPPEDRARYQLRVLVPCIMAYRQDTGQYPAKLTDLLEKPEGVENWRGGYGHKKLLVDPWKNNYVYRLTADPNHPCDLFSAGPDGLPDTKDDIQPENVD